MSELFQSEPSPQVREGEKRRQAILLKDGGSVVVEEIKPGTFNIVDSSITRKDGDPLLDPTELGFRGWDESVEDLDNGTSSISQLLGMSTHLRWEDVDLTPSKMAAPSLDRLKEALEHMNIAAYCPGDV